MEFDFDKPKLSVLCIGSESFYNGLSWALEQNPKLSKEFELLHYSISSADSLSTSNISLAVVSIDMGQPVPVESLRKLDVFLGLVVFKQPTPKQLLDLSKLSRWYALDWEGTEFSKILMELDQSLSTWSEERQREAALISLESWLQTSYHEVDRVSLENAPSDYLGAQTFLLEKSVGTVSFGGLASEASVKLPLNTKEMFFECVFKSGQWLYRKLSSSEKIEGVLNSRSVEVGDQIICHGLRLSMQRSDSATVVERVTRDFRHGDLPMRMNLNESSSLFDVLKFFLSAQIDGELRVRGPSKQATIFLEEGYIKAVFCGAISGRKGLLRILSWPSSQWRFLHGNKPPRESESFMVVGLSQFMELYEHWLQRWKNISQLIPPEGLKLKVKPTTFISTKNWNNRRYEVIARICEYSRVADVLNNTPLDDIDVYETLIDLRRGGLIETN